MKGSSICPHCREPLEFWAGKDTYGFRCWGCVRDWAHPGEMPVGCAPPAPSAPKQPSRWDRLKQRLGR